MAIIPPNTFEKLDQNFNFYSHKSVGKMDYFAMFNWGSNTIEHRFVIHNRAKVIRFLMMLF